MERESPGTVIELSLEQQQVVNHAEGPLLVTGPAGSGRTEALAARLARLSETGPPERVIVLCRSRAGAARLRARAEALIERPYGELWISTCETAAERLLREHPVEAGLDPFFTTVTAADRLAMLLDRVEELPLRRHEIRGNPTGLLARLLRRIDLLKSEAVSPGDLRGWADGLSAAASSPGARERAQRELEFAEVYARHERLLRDAGSLDSTDLVLELARLLADRPDVHEQLTARFEHVIADELEEAGLAHRRLLGLLAKHGNLVCACDLDGAVWRYRGAAASTAAAFRSANPRLAEIALPVQLRCGSRLARATAAIGGTGAAPVGGAPGADEGVVRLWRCRNERAQAQAVAREVEQLLAAGVVRPERICIVAAGGWREGRLIAAALEERSVPFRFAGDAAFFARPEVRDALAWLRMLADPGDAAAVARALTRPPVELRSADLARVTTIARRRKLDMVSALDAALESPQLPPEARDRIQSFLKLYSAAAAALENMSADAFVRRLIERIGLRRHRLFAASPETAERLINLSRLADLAAAWARREPRAATRDFIRHVTAVADAGGVGDVDTEPPGPGAVILAEPGQLKGLEFDHVYLLGMHRGGFEVNPAEETWVPDELSPDELPEAGEELTAVRRTRLAYLAATRARAALVLSWSEVSGDSEAAPSPHFEAVEQQLELEPEIHEEELFGPAEGLHSTYRMIREEVMEASWQAGSALSEMRLDTAEDVNRAVARFLELVKLGALIQHPGSEPTAETLAAIGELLGRVATPEQRAVLETSSLDEYVVSEEAERAARHRIGAARREPSLDQFIPRKGDGLALSASDLDLYRTCPLKYKFARVFAIPQEPTINQRFGILIHQVLERFHAEELQGAESGGGTEPGSLNRLLGLFESGWRRSGFGTSDDELQYRDRAVAALARYHERHRDSDASPVWLERAFSFRIGPHHLRGRVDRVDRLPTGDYRLIDYKTGGRSDAPELSGDLQIALYRLGAREAWQIEAATGSYWYVLDDEQVDLPAAGDDAERVERTVLEVAGGIESQDFEPRPSYTICSWCDYRLICPASEA
jgi:DNA helicase-2/ATP-dependent DNA helicase PcrA